MRVCFVEASRTRTSGVVKSNPNQVFFFVSCCHHIVILHIQRTTNQVLYFSRIYHHTTLYGAILSRASVGPTSEVRSSAVLLLIVENLKVRNLGRPQWHNFHTECHPNPCSGSGEYMR
jgi:hypothetical protein